MSYSRWSESRWYSFWTSHSGETKEEQYFEVMVDHVRAANFSYTQIKQDIDQCIEYVKVLCQNEKQWKCMKEIIDEESLPWGVRIVYEDAIDPPSPATQDELDELRNYMNLFVSDVEWEFGPLGRISNVLMRLAWPFKNIGYWIWLKTRPKRRYRKNLRYDFNETIPQEVEERV